jgi:urease accessory protein
MHNFLLLMQLTDSNFPSGAFSHSFGLETFVQQEHIKDCTQFKSFLEGYIDQLCYTDGLSARLVYDYLADDAWDKVLELDEVLHCSASATESRLGMQRIGQQMLRLYRALYPNTLLDDYAAAILQKKAYGHSSICQAILLFELKFPQEIAVQTIMYTACSTIIQNAVRGIPLGQTDGQKMFQLAVQKCSESIATIMQLTEKHVGCTSPMLEIKQMQHEHLHVRLFMS